MIDFYKTFNIQKDKLSRDYQLFPLAYFEKPTYEDFKYLYIDLNLSRKELIKYFNKGNGTIVRWVKFFNLEKTMGARELNKKKTFTQKYGKDSYMKTGDFKLKSSRTIQEKYHVSNIMKLKDTQDKVKQTLLQTTGYPYVFQNPESLQKARETNLQKRGVEYPAQDPVVKKKQNTGHTSKDEQVILTLLKTKFVDIKTQYSSQLYPFPCDFYIPELDMYIEYQGYWTHGGGVYNPENLQHQELLHKWVEKGWKRAVQTWSISDPLKRNVAKQNKLNWIEFFSINDFKKWLEVL